MGHADQIRNDGLAHDIHAQGDGQATGGGPEIFMIENVPQVDLVPVRIGNLDADRRLSGDRGDDTDARRLEGEGQVVRQIGDPVNLDPGCRLQFVHGDDRSRTDLQDPRLDAEVGQLVFQDPGIGDQRFLLLAEFPMLDGVEQGQGRELECLAGGGHHEGEWDLLRLGRATGLRGAGGDDGRGFLLRFLFLVRLRTPLPERLNFPWDRHRKQSDASDDDLEKPPRQNDQGEVDEDHEGNDQEGREDEIGPGQVEIAQEETGEQLAGKPPRGEIDPVEQNTRDRHGEQAGRGADQPDETRNADPRETVRPLQQGFQAGDHQDDGEPEDAEAEQAGQGVGGVRADGPGQIVNRGVSSREMGERGIQRMIGKQAQKQEQGACQADDTPNFSHPVALNFFRHRHSGDCRRIARCSSKLRTMTSRTFWISASRVSIV
ncbi:MAG TPA: hypothetical protein PK983_06450 [Syntrophales bacterium]|nr:hypothetical protein [Syntrophales bacterium]